MRLVNKHSKPVQVQLPQIESNIMALQGSTFFTALDMCSAYFHLPVNENSKKYLWMNGPNSFVQLHFMPFGALNAAAYFTLWIQSIHALLPRALQKNVIIYLDDILIHSTTIEHHLEILAELFPILAQHGVVLNSAKTELIKKHITYLGFSISQNKIRIKNDYMSKIEKWPTPNDLKTLEAFFGFVAYYQQSCCEHLSLPCQ